MFVPLLFELEFPIFVLVNDDDDDVDEDDELLLLLLLLFDGIIDAAAAATAAVYKLADILVGVVFENGELITEFGCNFSRFLHLARLF
jgi:hypothetical protein